LPLFVRASVSSPTWRAGKRNQRYARSASNCGRQNRAAVNSGSVTGSPGWSISVYQVHIRFLSIVATVFEAMPRGQRFEATLDQRLNLRTALFCVP
jgi:hypothetical protein